MTHTLDPQLLERPIRILVVGCGGNGSAIVSGLPYLHQAMLAFGHPGGLQVTLIDPDTVSETNCVRRPFCRTEVGLSKAIVLAHRINLFWGLNWQGMQAQIFDQGYFFNAGEWSFPDAPLRGVFGRNDVYAGITGWDSFEPWLSRIESLPESSLWPLVDQIPAEWYGSATYELGQLLTRLLERRSRVRELILSFKNSSRNPFPNWREVSSVAAVTSLRPRGRC